MLFERASSKQSFVAVQGKQTYNYCIGEQMKEKIRESINDFDALEYLYRQNKDEFKSAVKELHEEDAADKTISVWYARLFYKAPQKPSGKQELLRTILEIAVPAVIAWLPFLVDVFLKYEWNSNLDHNMQIVKAVAFSLMVSCFFVLRSKFSAKPFLAAFLAHLLVFLYFFFFIEKHWEKQFATNASAYVIILFWFVAYICYSNFKPFNKKTLSAFVFLSGEFIVWYTIFCIGAFVILLLFEELFDALGANEISSRMEDVLVFLMCLLPFISIWFIEKTKYKFTSILSAVFQPVFLTAMIIFIVLSFFSTQKVYQKRDLFILYNIVLVFVLCFLVYSSSGESDNKFLQICSCALAVVTVLFDIYMLGATIYRISSYGITANKCALLLTNIVMLGNLAFILYRSVRTHKLRVSAEEIAVYLPVYAVLAMVIVFILPLVFRTA